jgi:hypothetical protein
MGVNAQTSRSSKSSALNRDVAAFRASSLYPLTSIRLQNVNLKDKTAAEVFEWLNSEIIAGVASNKPRIRIEVRPIEITIPAHPPAVDSVITAQVAMLREADETWRAAIASNSARRVAIEGSNMTALEVLKTCCSQADLQYADDGSDIVIGNVYFLQWPPQIECRVFAVSEDLVRQLGENIKDIIAPAPFHDSRRDWITLVPEQNVLVIFHHQGMMAAIASSVEYANRNAGELISRSKTAPPLEKRAKTPNDGR